MSSQRNPLLGAQEASSDASSMKRPYRAPELRELGAVADLTRAGEDFPVDTDSAPYGSGGPA